jgi:hypothetical protein
LLLAGASEDTPAYCRIMDFKSTTEREFRHVCARFQAGKIDHPPSGFWSQAQAKVGVTERLDLEWVIVRKTFFRPLLENAILRGLDGERIEWPRPFDSASLDFAPFDVRSRQAGQARQFVSGSSGSVATSRTFCTNTRRRSHGELTK